MKTSLSGNSWSGSSWDGKSVYTKKTQEQNADGSYVTITADFRKYACVEDSIADHAAYLLGAMNGSRKRYEGLAGVIVITTKKGKQGSSSFSYTGKDVTEFHEGQKVTIEPQVYCGQCYPCRHGKYNLCEELKVMGFQTTGTASEYFAVDASKVTPIPEDMSYEEGAMIEPLAVAVHGVKQVGDVKGLNIAVLGAGPIGNLVAQAAKGMGAAKVMITDVSDLRLDKAKECGIDVCVNTMEKDFGEAMVEAFGPDKADVIYDCAGNNITMGQAIKYARKGSIIVLVAVFAGMATVDLAVANDHELDIKSTMMYRHDDYVDGIELVNEGKVHLRPLISKTFAFKDYLKAYQYIDDNRETTMKVIINVQEK